MADNIPLEAPSVPIPQPPPHFLTGNMGDVDASFFANSIWRLASIYGPIFKLELPGVTSVVVSTHELVNEVCDEERFEKTVSGGLREVRALTGDGLFTAYGNEPVSVPPLDRLSVTHTATELGKGSSNADASVWSIGYPEDVSANDGHRISNDS